MTLSDIVTTSGSSLDLSKRNGRPGLRSSVTQWLKVNQDRPSEAIWKIWKKANLLSSTEGGLLHHLLGRWLVPIYKQRQRHYAYKYGSRIAIRTDYGYQIKRRLSPDQPYVSIGILLHFHQLPDDSQPTDVLYCHTTDSWLLPTSRLDHQFIAPEIRQRSLTFAEYISSLDPWETELLCHIEIATDPDIFCDRLTQGLRAVSDGSVRHTSQGAYGWSLSTPDGERIATSMGPVFGLRPQSYIKQKDMECCPSCGS